MSNISHQKKLPLGHSLIISVREELSEHYLISLILGLFFYFWLEYDEDVEMQLCMTKKKIRSSRYMTLF